MRLGRTPTASSSLARFLAERLGSSSRLSYPGTEATPASVIS